MDYTLLPTENCPQRARPEEVSWLSYGRPCLFRAQRSTEPDITARHRNGIGQGVSTAYVVLVLNTAAQLRVEVRHQRAASMIETDIRGLRWDGYTFLDPAMGYDSSARRGRMVSTPMAYGVEVVCLSGRTEG